MSKSQKNTLKHPAPILPEDIRVVAIQLANELLRLLHAFDKPPDKQAFANHIHKRFPDFKVFVWNPNPFYKVQLNCPAVGNLTFTLNGDKCKLTAWQNPKLEKESQKTKGAP